MVNNRIYAPVIIPTLNRFVHFKRCLESIERCTGAQYTDVFIGLDYPPSEKYVEGWKKIDAYLKEKEHNHGFKNLYVHRREVNCGVGTEKSNGSLLVQEVSKSYDRYILSEDDNEFSPNFLEYMNQGLEKYKDDERVIKISAYVPPFFYGLTQNTTFFGIDTPAYGIGSWVKKNPFQKFTNDQITFVLQKSLLRSSKWFHLYPSLINSAVHMIKKNHNYGDIRYSIYNLINGTFTLTPTSSLARNWGADGSGIHSGIVPGIEKYEIQTASTFTMSDIPFDYPNSLKKKLRYHRMPQNIVKYFIHYSYAYLLFLKFFFLNKR